MLYCAIYGSLHMALLRLIIYLLYAEAICYDTTSSMCERSSLITEAERPCASGKKGVERAPQTYIMIE